MVGYDPEPISITSSSSICAIVPLRSISPITSGIFLSLIGRVISSAISSDTLGVSLIQAALSMSPGILGRAKVVLK